MEFVLSELCEQVVTARAAQRQLLIRGGGTRLFYGGPLPPEGAASWLDLSAYHGVVSYEPSELVLTARAGTPLAEIETLLASQGQMLAFEPPRFGAAGTIGGCVAAGMAGPRRMAAGPLADFVLGARLLGPHGKPMRFGGEVMKNVAGYDVSRLLAGSLGVLGPIVEVSIKVLPRPRREESVVLALDEAAALRQCVDWRSQAIPVSATAWTADDTGRGQLVVRLSGNESAVRQSVAQIGGERLAQAEAQAFWDSLRDQTHEFFSHRPLWRVVLPPGVPALQAGAELHEWQGCLRWLAGPQDAQALRERVGALGGSAAIQRGDASTQGVPVFQPLAPALLAVHQRLKQQLDPAGVFNPGRMTAQF